MEHNIGVGILVGLITTTSIYIWQSESFTKTQKVILLMCIIFPPLQWVGIFILKYYNKVKLENSPERVAEKKSEAVKIKLDSTIENLKDLKEKGILSEEEYKQKTQKLESEKAEQDLKNSTEYKQLKSLLDSGVLTKEEFEVKTERLKNLELKTFKKEVVVEQNFVDKTHFENIKINKIPSDSEIWKYMLKIIIITFTIATIFWIIFLTK